MFTSSVDKNEEIKNIIDKYAVSTLINYNKILTYIIG